VSIHRSDGGLRVTSFDWRWAAQAVIGFGLAMLSILMYVQGNSWTWIVGWFLAWMVPVTYAVTQSEWSDFRFESRSRQVHWKRCTLLSSRHGTIDFDDILSAEIEYKYEGGGENPMDTYRILLKTRDKVIPITKRRIGVAFNGRKFCEACSAINGLLGADVNRVNDAEIKELLRRGMEEEAFLLVKRRECLGNRQIRRYLKQLNDVRRQA